MCEELQEIIYAVTRHTWQYPSRIDLIAGMDDKVGGRDKWTRPHICMGHNIRDPHFVKDKSCS